MELKIPIEIVFDDVNSVIDELGKLQTYKLFEGDDMILVDVDDVVDVLTRHVMAREAKEPCGTKEGWIPCSERLPERGTSILMASKQGWVAEGEYKGVLDGRHLWIEYRWSASLTNGEIIAWMPLPKGYKGE